MCLKHVPDGRLFIRSSTPFFEFRAGPDRSLLGKWWIYVLFLAMMTFVTADVLEVRYSFESPHILQRSDGYFDISVKEMVPFGAPGHPLLPEYPALVMLPPGCDVVNAEITVKATTRIGETVRVNYCRGKNPTGTSYPVTVGPEAFIYGSELPYPQKPVSFVTTSYCKGYGIAVVRINPFVYFPANNELYFNQEMILKLELIRQGKMTRPAGLRPFSQDREDVAKLVDNPSMCNAYIQPSLKRVDTAFEYLIVTDSLLFPEFQALADHKAAKGLNVHMELMSDILAQYPGGDDAEKLRNFIIYAWQNHGTRYLLLGGDTEIVPYRGLYGNMLNAYIDYYIPSDFYFAALDGNWNANDNPLFGEPDDDVDLFAEIDVGRISASSPGEARNQINKIINYENSTPPFSALLLGEKLDDFTWGGDISELVYQKMGGIPAQRLYDLNGVWTADELIQNYLNTNEIHIINHNGHSNAEYNMRMYNPDVDSLFNTVPFFIYTSGCLPAAFDFNVCFGEKITGGTPFGAFAVVMNSRYGWYHVDAVNGSSDVFAQMFMQSVFEQSVRRPGTALNRSRHKLAAYVVDGTYRWVYYCLNLLGCPETELHWACAPGSLRISPDYPSDGFYVMQNDRIPLIVAVHTDCVGIADDATVTAEASMDKGSRQVITLKDDGIAPDETGADGLFSGWWTPENVGPATLLYQAEGSGYDPVDLELNGDVLEETHYTVQETEYHWTDMSLADSVYLGWWYDGHATVDIDFPFVFYGMECDSVIISENGVLQFAPGYSGDSDPLMIPDILEPNAVVAALWTDLQLAYPGIVRYLVTGNPPYRRFLVEWHRIAHMGNIGEVSFQVVLEESTNNIYVAYQDTFFGDVYCDHGNDAVAGIEDFSGRHGTLYSFHQPVLTDGLAMVYSPIQQGDLNGDGVVDSNDLLVLRHIIAENVLPGFPPALYPGKADLDENGRLDLNDCMILAVWLVE